MERFLKLYGEVYQDLYRFACYYLGNPQDAEDAVQDAALAAWKHFGELKREEAFRAWIFQILVNICRRSLRKKGRHGFLSEDPAKDQEVWKKELQEQNLSERLEILELLSGLDEEERLIVLLFVFGGYKGEEIAGMLGRRHSTIRSRYRRALKKLEQTLQKKEEKE